MKKNAFIWLLIFSAVQILTGCGVLTSKEHEDGLVKTGAYLWEIKGSDGSIKSERLYIKASGKNLTFYSERMILDATLTGNHFEGLNGIQEKRIYISGTVDGKNQIAGYYSIWYVLEANPKNKYEFAIKEDPAPDAKAYWEKIFIDLEQTSAKSNSNWRIPKDTAEGRRIRAKLEKRAKEKHVNFEIAGRIVDSENKPITDADVQVSILSIDPDGIMGGKTISKYFLTDKEGQFKVENCLGVSVSVYAYKAGYNRTSKTFDGPEELKKLKDNPIIIKIEPNAKKLPEEYEDGLIKTGAYIWKIKNPGGPMRSDRFYIKSSGKNLEFYSDIIFLKATITGNRFDGITERGEENTYINGSVDAKGQVSGYCEDWNVFEPNEKSMRYEFAFKEDTSPDVKAYWENYFKSFEQMKNKDSKFIIPPGTTSAYGRRMRAMYEKAAKEENVSFVVKGKLIDSTEQPVGGIVIQLLPRAHDPDGPMGMSIKEIYVTSNKDGIFESEPLIGDVLCIAYKGNKYQHINKSFRGKKELLKLKDNPVIIKLEPNANSK